MGARGPLSNERLSIDGDGPVVHELKRPFRYGTTQCLFEPLDFLARLAARYRARAGISSATTVSLHPTPATVHGSWRRAMSVRQAQMRSPRLRAHALR